MKLNHLILFAVFSLFLFSCDDGIKFDNPLDQNADISDSSDSQNDEDKDSTDSIADEDPNEQTDTENPDKKQGELDGECYPNKTCNDGLICDKDNNICIKDSESSENNDDNDADTTPDSSDSAPDNDTDTDSGDSTPDNDTDTDSGDNGSGTTVEEEEEEDDGYDYEKCIEINLDSKLENKTDWGLLLQGFDRLTFRTSYDPRTGSDPDKEDYLNFEFCNTGQYLTGSYDLAKKKNYSSCFNYSSSSGGELILVVYEDGGAKNYIQRKGTVLVTPKESASSIPVAQLTNVFLEEVTIDKSTHETTVVPDGACLKINDTKISG